MKKYCKAYLLKDLRQFNGWTENRENEATELADDDVVYLWDDFTVVQSPVIPDKGLVFDVVTPEWRNFCTTTLGFVIPEDLRYAYEASEQDAVIAGDDSQNATPAS
jgi:hypothetical protein